MATTTLRAYLEEVKRLLEKEALEEVIGHCRHILQHFPKNLETYRLLGQALLEKNRHQEAADVFNRVLGSVPDDFTAHVGLSACHEEKNDFTKAIWHMERAFELEPNNTALQSEIRRLQERNNLPVVERIPMSRAALARVYYRGKLYEQAISELQKQLAQTPDRVDLMTLLASALARSERHGEASEIALKILEKLPDSLEANRIMAALWLGNDRPSDARPFFDRLEQLDPFLAWTVAQGEGSEPPSTAFQLPKLAWDVRSAQALATGTPDWINTIGEVFEDPTKVDLGSRKRTGWIDDTLGQTQARPGTTGLSKPATGKLPKPKTGGLIDRVKARTGGLKPLPETPATPPAPIDDDVPEWFREFMPVFDQKRETGASALPIWLDDEGLPTADLPLPSELDPDAAPDFAITDQATSAFTGSDEFSLDAAAFDSPTFSAPAFDSPPEVSLESPALADAVEPAVPPWLIDSSADSAADAVVAAQPDTGTSDLEQGDLDWSLFEQAQNADALATSADLDWSFLEQPAESEPVAPAEEIPAVADGVGAGEFDWLSADAASAQPEWATPETVEPAAGLDLPAVAESADAATAGEFDWLSADAASVQPEWATPETVEPAARLDMPAAAESADAATDGEFDWLSADAASAQPEWATPETVEPAAGLDPLAEAAGEFDWNALNIPAMGVSTSDAAELQPAQGSDFDWLNPSQPAEEMAEAAELSGLHAEVSGEAEPPVQADMQSPAASPAQELDDVLAWLNLDADLPAVEEPAAPLIDSAVTWAEVPDSESAAVAEFDWLINETAPADSPDLTRQSSSGFDWLTDQAQSAEPSAESVQPQAGRIHTHPPTADAPAAFGADLFAADEAGIASEPAEAGLNWNVQPSAELDSEAMNWLMEHTQQDAVADLPASSTPARLEVNTATPAGDTDEQDWLAAFSSTSAPAAETSSGGFEWLNQQPTLEPDSDIRDLFKSPPAPEPLPESVEAVTDLDWLLGEDQPGVASAQPPSVAAVTGDDMEEFALLFEENQTGPLDDHVSDVRPSGEDPLAWAKQAGVDVDSKVNPRPSTDDLFEEPVAVESAPPDPLAWMKQAGIEPPPEMVQAESVDDSLAWVKQAGIELDSEPSAAMSWSEHAEGAPEAPAAVESESHVDEAADGTSLLRAGKRLADRIQAQRSDAETPSWLAEVPTLPTAEEPIETPITGGDDLDWLTAIGDTLEARTDTSAEKPAKKEKVDTGWLSNFAVPPAEPQLSDSGILASVTPAEQDSGVISLESEAMPDWMTAFSEEASASPVSVDAQPSETPVSEQIAETQQPAARPPAIDPRPSSSTRILPEHYSVKKTQELGDEEEPQATSADLIAAPGQPAKAEAALELPEGEMPAWLKVLKGEPIVLPDSLPTAREDLESLIRQASAEVAEETGLSTVDAVENIVPGEVPDWFASFRPGPPAPPVKKPTTPLDQLDFDSLNKPGTAPLDLEGLEFDEQPLSLEFGSEADIAGLAEPPRPSGTPGVQTTKLSTTDNWMDLLGIGDESQGDAVSQPASLKSLMDAPPAADAEVSAEDKGWFDFARQDAHAKPSFLDTQNAHSVEEEVEEDWLRIAKKATSESHVMRMQDLLASQNAESERATSPSAIEIPEWMQDDDAFVFPPPTTSVTDSGTRQRLTDSGVLDLSKPADWLDGLEGTEPHLAAPSADRRPSALDIDWLEEQHPSAAEASTDEQDWLTAMPLPKPGATPIPEPPHNEDDTRPSRVRSLSEAPQPPDIAAQPARDVMADMLNPPPVPTPDQAPVRMTGILTTPDETSDADLPDWLRDDEGESSARTGGSRGSTEGDDKSHFDINRRPAWMRGKRPGRADTGRQPSADQGKDRKKDKTTAMPDDIAGLLNNILEQNDQDSDLPDWMRK